MSDRDAAVRERDQAREALRRISVLDTRYGHLFYQAQQIARAALTGEGTTHEARVCDHPDCGLKGKHDDGFHVFDR